MQIKCPHCQHHIEVVEAEPEVATRCPACGSHLSVVVETRSYRPPPARLVEGFQLLERVGVGHFGEVWKARDQRLDRIVAIKLPRTHLLDHDAFNTFVREAQSAAQLRHPNIVAVYDVIQEQDRLFTVSEFIQGVSLAEYMQVEKFSARKAAELCATLADALHHAHEAGVIHRDLKPGNILLDAQLAPHVTDFGLAKREGDEITITVEGQILGTPAYMSPEQAAGKGHAADRRCDVYSLGVILYELLAGRRPFLGGSRLLIHQIQHEDPPALRRLDRHIPRDLETICLKALAKFPAERYGTAAAMADDLRRYLRGETIRARPASQFERAWRWCRRNPAIATATTVAFVAITLAAGLAWSNYRSHLTHDEQQTTHGQAIAEQQKQTESVQHRLNAVEKMVPKRRSVLIATEPPGAEIVFYPIDTAVGRVAVDKGVAVPPGEAPVVELNPGSYLVVARLSTGDFHEVFRYVPVLDTEKDQRFYRHQRFAFREGRVHLDSIRILPTSEVLSGMALIRGSDRFSPQWGGELQTVAVPDYYLDCTEVTVAEFRQRWPNHPALAKDGDADALPITGVNLDDAIAYAEMSGKIVPDETMFEYAALNRGTTRFPWGDSDEHPPSWRLGLAAATEFDRLDTEPPVLGLMSNAVEWVTSGPPTLVLRADMVPLGSLMAIVRGGPAAVLSDQVPEVWGDVSGRSRFAILAATRHASLGFRCARSVRPRSANDAPSTASVPPSSARPAAIAGR